MGCDKRGCYCNLLWGENINLGCLDQRGFTAGSNHKWRRNREDMDTIDVGSVTALSDLPESNRLESDQDNFAPITPNGQLLLALAKTSDGYARIWDASTGNLKAKLGDGNYKISRAF